ncbi:hypothetical protein PR048_007828 [Dryococelus australis]|uniref:Uncharacterized protein n=1 Tax=Dryococelus australis TaxID=614101 RepID=A0ABQ9HVE5_9NEOP|nr:hypothetical protein PR048_007828 [Dryococelus australis]
MAERLDCSLPTSELGSIPGRVTPSFLASRNSVGRCRWSAGFLGDLLFPHLCIPALVEEISVEGTKVGLFRKTVCTRMKEGIFTKRCNAIAYVSGRIILDVQEMCDTPCLLVALCTAPILAVVSDFPLADHFRRPSLLSWLVFYRSVAQPPRLPTLKTAGSEARRTFILSLALIWKVTSLRPVLRIRSSPTGLVFLLSFKSCYLFPGDRWHEKVKQVVGGYRPPSRNTQPGRRSKTLFREQSKDPFNGCLEVSMQRGSRRPPMSVLTIPDADTEFVNAAWPSVKLHKPVECTTNNAYSCWALIGHQLVNHGMQVSIPENTELVRRILAQERWLLVTSRARLYPIEARQASALPSALFVVRRAEGCCRVSTLRESRRVGRKAVQVLGDGDLLRPASELGLPHLLVHGRNDALPALLRSERRLHPVLCRRHVGSTFANQRPVTHSPAGSPTNREHFVACYSRSDARRKVVSYSAPTETAPRRVYFRPPPPVSPPPPEQTRALDSHESALATRRRRARTQLTSLSAGPPWHPTVEWPHPRTRRPAASSLSVLFYFVLSPPPSFVLRSDPTYASSRTSKPISVASYSVNLRPIHSEFSQVGIVPDDAADRRVFLGISRFPPPFHSGTLHTHFTLIGSPDLTVKNRPNLFTPSVSSLHLSSEKLLVTRVQEFSMCAAVDDSDSLRFLCYDRSGLLFLGFPLTSGMKSDLVARSPRWERCSLLLHSSYITPSPEFILRGGGGETTRQHQLCGFGSRRYVSECVCGGDVSVSLRLRVAPFRR